MKKYILILVFLFSISICQAQIKAITETGDEVLLYEGGTWKYVNEPKAKEVTEIKTNSKKFSKAKTSSFLLKSTRAKFGFWVNTTKWKFEKAESNEAAEYELQLKSGDLYAMIVSEKVEIPVENLRDIAVKNGKSAAPDLVVVSEEYRMVNGLKVLCMQMNGTLQGIKFAYYGYYYSNSNGTVQFLTYTSQNLLGTMMPEIEELLNGIVEID